MSIEIKMGKNIINTSEDVTKLLRKATYIALSGFKNRMISHVRNDLCISDELMFKYLDHIIKTDMEFTDHGFKISLDFNDTKIVEYESTLEKPKTIKFVAEKIFKEEYEKAFAQIDVK